MSKVLSNFYFKATHPSPLKKCDDYFFLALDWRLKKVREWKEIELPLYRSIFLPIYFFFKWHLKKKKPMGALWALRP